MKAEVVSYNGRCMNWKAGTVTQKVKSLPEIIGISGDLLKSNIKKIYQNILQLMKNLIRSCLFSYIVYRWTGLF